MITAWHRLKDEKETSKAYAAFCIYRDRGAERSIEKVQETLRKRSGYVRQLYTWSSKYRWVERAAAYDDYRDQERQKRLKSLLDEHDEEAMKEAVEIRKLSADVMRHDKPGSWAVTHRWIGAIDAVQKLAGRDKKVVELGGQVTIDVTKSPEYLEFTQSVYDALTPEQRVEYAKKLKGQKDDESS